LKVGLLVGHTQPTAGGEYNYIVEILEALGRLVTESNHEFVLFHRDCDALVQRFPCFRSVDLGYKKRLSLNWLGRQFEKRPKFRQRVSRFLRLDAPSGDDEAAYRQEGIQFILQLSPFEIAKHDLPYGVVIWDLAHRNWPCFPEVGDRTTWIWRQQHFELLIGRASIIYTGTKTGQRELETYFQVPPHKTRILQFPTPSFAIRAAERPIRSDVLRRLGVPKEYVFYPAQFWAHKNHTIVLEALKLIRGSTDWDLGVVFVGSDKGNREYVRDYALRLGLQESSKIIDFVSQEDLIDLYKGAFCLAYATFFGPDNLPPLEAFALGCPVVASAVSGAEEQRGSGALLFAPHDEHELAQHILALQNPEVRSELIRNGKKMRHAFTWEDYARDLLRSLDDFVAIRRAWGVGKG
jgi:glycosyltransferase involved in cell wall biosynthesis